MKKWVLAVMALAVVSAGASAQDVKAGPEAKVAFEKRSYPFEGEVSVERLNVRMFPKADAVGIITSVLGLGEKVTVVAEKDEYYQILPPRGSTVWVSSKSVKRDGEKAVALVNDVPVRMDSRVNADVLCSLKEGDAVKVAGEHMGWLKIEAPAAVKYYVGRKYVHLGKELPPEALPVNDVKKPAGTARADASDADALRLIDSARRELDVQTRLVNEGKVSQVDFSSVVADFEAARGKAKSETVRAEAEDGLKRYRDISAILTSAKAAIAIKEKELDENRKAAASKVAEKPVPAFQGYIEPVGLLFKRPGSHKLVMGGKIVCFLRLKEGDEKTMARMNDNYQRFVGVNGAVIKDPDGWLGYSVVVVDEFIAPPREQ